MSAAVGPVGTMLTIGGAIVVIADVGVVVIAVVGIIVLGKLDGPDSLDGYMAKPPILEVSKSLM